jgi:hypothetical protein
MADEPVLAEAPAATTTEAPVDLTTKIEDVTTEAAPAPKADATEVVDGEATEGEQEPKKNIPGSQRLKRRLALVEADFLAQQTELETLRRERQAAAPKTDGKPGVDREPTEADFPSDWFAFQESKTAWTARQAIRDEFNRVREEQSRANTQHVQTERQRERLEVYHENADEARERIPDFDTVIATAKAVNINAEVREELLSSDKSALLQYHLAKNPDKAKALNELTGRELAREIGRLEARVHLPTAKRATEATPPPSEVKGAAATQIDPRTGPDDMNAYAAWRAKQRAKSQ